MIPMKLTENHYINPEAIDQLLIRPKTDERPAAIPLAAILAGDVIGFGGAGDHGEAPALFPALGHQSHHRHLIDSGH